MSSPAKLALGAGLAALAAGLWQPGLAGVGLLVVAMVLVGLSLTLDRRR